MVPQNALQRTFRIKSGSSEGTCFTIDIEGKQYVVTAKHVINGQSFPSDIHLLHEKTWKPERADLVGIGPTGVDVAVMTLSRQLSPTLPLEPSCAELFWGQDVHFLGFPYGLFGDVGQANGDYPIPFIKRAAVSGMSPHGSSPRIIYLDGHNNPGFSGGPVVYRVGFTERWGVAAIVSGFQYKEEPIYQGAVDTGLIYRYNTGIVLSYDIAHAVALVNANPIGFIF